MKNIFLKETDQKSKLYRNLLTDKLFILEDKVTDVSECNREYQFIYITNNEEIKEGDWCYHPLLKWGSVIKSKYDEPNSTMKKIILTTDQDLIKDGVQSIDDEFLEWFVKNPSCEVVKIEKEKVILGQVAGTTYTDFNYKIIIPKEEPKQDLEKEMFDLEQELDIPSNLRFHNSKPKKETIEEAAERYCLINNIPIDQMIIKNDRSCEFETPITMFVKGAKWQAERMYSEEDLHNAFYNGWIYRGENYTFPKAKKEWLEQFKNR